jgi:hypothetical protein
MTAAPNLFIVCYNAPSRYKAPEEIIEPMYPLNKGVGSVFVVGYTRPQKHCDLHLN